MTTQCHCVPESSSLDQPYLIISKSDDLTRPAPKDYIMCVYPTRWCERAVKPCKVTLQWHWRWEVRSSGCLSVSKIWSRECSGAYWETTASTYGANTAGPRDTATVWSSAISEQGKRSSFSIIFCIKKFLGITLQNQWIFEMRISG